MWEPLHELPETRLRLSLPQSRATPRNTLRTRELWGKPQAARCPGRAGNLCCSAYVCVSSEQPGPPAKGAALHQVGMCPSLRETQGILLQAEAESWCLLRAEQTLSITPPPAASPTLPAQPASGGSWKRWIISKKNPNQTKNKPC